MSKIKPEKFNRMWVALDIIRKAYSAQWILRNAERVYGCDGYEALEMAYENLRDQAKTCLHRIRPIMPKANPASEPTPTEIQKEK